MSAASFSFGGLDVRPGTRQVIDIEISQLSNSLPMGLPVQVIHGSLPGPVLFISAAVHGDEIIGVEVIRRLAQRPSLEGLRGTLLLVPVVNGYGFINHSRYLPDRRDLNRSFPGSETGSLAARLAHIFLEQVVSRADYGIDLHSAAIHRENLPQIRVSDGDGTTLDLAKAFGAPSIVVSDLRDGSLRIAAAQRDVPVLLFEGGEGLRFDETAVRAGLAGILRVMTHVGMIDGDTVADAPAPPVLSRKSQWLRAPEGGLLRLWKDLGETVEAGEAIGVVSDLFGEREHEITAGKGGLIIGRVTMPIVNEGDAIAHIAQVDGAVPVNEHVEAIVGQLDNAAMFYEDEII